MKDWDDEIYGALAHPVRRRIIECLQEKKNVSFHELLKYVDIGNHGKLGFHIKALGELVERHPSKKRYRLTDRGQLASELIWDIRYIIEREADETSHMNQQDMSSVLGLETTQFSTTIQRMSNKKYLSHS